MTEIIFVRHGEPVRTTEHHALWGITEVDKVKAAKSDLQCLAEPVLFCSTLQRAYETCKATFPKKEPMRCKIFDEIEKPIEDEDLFRMRVLAGIDMLEHLIRVNAYTQPVIVFCHSRFMSVAYYKYFKKPAIGFDFLGSFKVSV